MKILKIFFFIFLLSIPSSILASVPETTDVPISDFGELLEPWEEDLLIWELSDLAQSSGWEVFILTTTNADGLSTMVYSENFLDSHLSGSNGMVFNIDMDNREVYVATTGSTIQYLTDSRVNAIIDSGYDFIVNEDYYSAFSNMISTTLNYYFDGIPQDQYNYYEETPESEKKFQLELHEILIALVIGGAAFGIVYGGTWGSYKTKWNRYRYDFHKNSFVNLQNKNDLLIDQSVTFTRIQSPSSSSRGINSSVGRSSFHGGSGGRSFGGGGRKF